MPPERNINVSCILPPLSNEYSAKIKFSDLCCKSLNFFYIGLQNSSADWEVPLEGHLVPIPAESWANIKGYIMLTSGQPVPSTNYPL